MAAQPVLTRVAPGVAALRSCRRNDLPHDVVAGLSATAIAVPVLVAVVLATIRFVKLMSRPLVEILREDSVRLLEEVIARKSHSVDGLN